MGRISIVWSSQAQTGVRSSSVVRHGWNLLSTTNPRCQDQCGVCGGKKIIHDYLLMRKSAQWIPWLFRPLQKQEIVTCSQALLVMGQENQEDFFNRLITHDETRVHHYDPETHLRRRHVSNPRRARSCSRSLIGPAWSRDDEFIGNGYHNYRDLLRFGVAEIGGDHQTREAWHAKVATSCQTTPRSQLKCCPCRRKHGPAAMKSFLIPVTLQTSHHLTPTSFQLWSNFWRASTSQTKKHWVPAGQVVAFDASCRLLQTRSPQLHKVMGDACDPWWFLCKERLITLPSFFSLSLCEMS